MSAVVDWHRSRAVLIALFILIVGLMLVGVVSGTVLRHALQIAPATVFALLLLRGQSWARYSALAIFLFWLTIMALIWLFLLGVVTFFDGQFAPIEVVLTVVVGISCGIGSIAVVRGTGGSALVAVSAFLLGAGMQFLTMWLSFQQQFVRD